MMFLLGLSEETTLVNVISSLADGAAPVGRSDGYSFICGSSLGKKKKKSKQAKSDI